MFIRGKILIFEGPDGVGKTTLINYIKERHRNPFYMHLRVHKNMKASSDKLHSSPTHVSASVHAEGAKQFAELKQSSDNPHDELHYAAYHIDKDDEVCHVHPHSPMYSGGGGDEHEVTIKPHSVWKHVGTTTHLSNTGGWHVVDHFKRHKS